MAVDYTNITTEVLGQMMQAAKRSPGVATEQLAVLQKAVEARKQQLEARLVQAEKSKDADKLQLSVYQELIALEPDNEAYYYKAGQICYWALEAYRDAIAY